jgi:hypothetical protein
MRDSAFESVARHAAMSRRRSLRLLSGAGLAGVLAAPTDAGAGKARKNARRQCRNHAAQCRAGIETYCEIDVPDDPTCPEPLIPCCEHFAQCRSDLGIECLITGQPLPAARG